MNNGMAGYPTTQPDVAVGPMSMPSPGRWTSLVPTVGASSTSSGSNEFITFYPFVAMGKITDAAIECTTLQAASVVSVAVYRNRQFYPAERVVRLIDADMTSTGIKTNSVQFDFGDRPTWWWLSWCSFATTPPTFRSSIPLGVRASGQANNESGLLESSNTARIGMGRQLPSSLGMPSSAIGFSLTAASGATTMPYTIVKWAP